MITLTNGTDFNDRTTTRPLARCCTCGFVGEVNFAPPRMMWLFGYQGTQTDWMREHGWMLADDHGVGPIRCPCGSIDVEGNGCAAFVNAEQRRLRRARQHRF